MSGRYRYIRRMGMWRIYISRGRFQLKLPGSWDGIHITAKELLPIVIGAALWGEQWRGQTVRCLCDNAAVVAVILSGSSEWCTS